MDSKDFDAASLAVVCCYFNPLHYQSRRRNYELFAAGIRKVGVHLQTVELASGNDAFDLPANADNLQLRTADLMWQKERLLNIGISHISPNFTKIAWFDGDIIFDNEKWPQELCRALDRYALVQCFKDVAYLPAHATSVVPGCPRKMGWVYALNETAGAMYGECGFAWAAQRQIFEKCALYDVRVLGGADLLMALACIENKNILSLTESLMRFESFRSFNSASIEHYWKWLLKFKAAIGNNFSYLNQTVYPLFHGDLKNRLYTERAAILSDYDPNLDVARTENGCWGWNSAKLSMHSKVRQYFEMRREDSV